MPFNIKEYKLQRDELRQRFQDAKTGDQSLFIDQVKLFKPLIESSKAIENKITSSQDVLSNTLLPFTRELQKRNEQVDVLQNLPFYNTPLHALPTAEIEGIHHSTPKPIHVDLDGALLNQTHSENLQDMGLDLPSIVQRNGKFQEALNKIKTESKRIGQFLGKSSKKDDKEKAVYESQKQTIKVYKEKIKGLIGAEQFIKPKKVGEGLTRQGAIVKPKRGRGRPRKYPDVILYNNPDELCVKLSEKVTAKKAGNTGLDNIITSILDELLNIKYINKNDCDNLLKNIFWLI